MWEDFQQGKSVLVLLIIFIILFVVLWSISSCGSFMINNYIFLDSLFGAAAILYFFYILFTPGEFWWKIVAGIILFLFILSYIQRVGQCSKWKQYFSTETRPTQTIQ